jgi:hypothetical protein
MEIFENKRSSKGYVWIVSRQKQSSPFINNLSLTIFYREGFRVWICAMSFLVINTVFINNVALNPVGP